MKEIEIKDLNKYIDPLSLKQNPAIALARDGSETNGLTIGWLSLGVLWKKYCATVYVHAQRYSKHIFDNAEYFSVCFMKDEHKGTLKYFGTVSGRDENKINNCGLKITNDLTPYFNESKIVIICRVMGKSDFDINNVDEGVKDWYNKDGVHTQYYGEIIKVLINE